MKPALWFYGLSGSGKTTLAKYACEVLKINQSRVVFLDADELRKEYWPEVGLSKDARLQNTRRIAKLAKSYHDLDCPVIVASCAPFQQQREEILTIFPAVKFILVDTPISVCEIRKPNAYGASNINKVTKVDTLPSPWNVINCDQNLNISFTDLDFILKDV